MSNALAKEKSPYLLQHKDNPVNWLSWSKEAFEKAKKEDKPIFLSIGYSTCHWCHVMAHESFEDKEVAELLNKDFVSIKVDREERPDIDSTYMTIARTMNGFGGWPLTIIMTAEKKPFLAATYLPKYSRFGVTGLIELLPKISDLWKNRRQEVLNSAENISSLLKEGKNFFSEKIGEEILPQCFEQLKQGFEKEKGGFGFAPKFPVPHNLLFLLHYFHNAKNPEALEMAEKTLTEMRFGGIFDQIGFGFHRYSTDFEWLLPHFEKMLYDQAMISLAYIEAFQATGNIFYKNTAEEVLEYVLRDLTFKEGGFYSAEDADSEGVEGKFYLWKKKEIEEILSKEEAKFVVEKFGVEEEGNFLEEATKQKTGENILHLKENLSEEDSKKWKSIREKIFLERRKRIHPLKDDKILTDWNGLMIASFAKAYAVFGEKKYLEAGEKAADFVFKNLYNGKLLHSFKEKPSSQGFLDDYAFFVFGLIELYEASFNAKYLEKALLLSEEMLEHFWDAEGKGFFFSPDYSEKILERIKEFSDTALPSGNSIAVYNLLRLSRLSGRQEFEEKAFEAANSFAKYVLQSPASYSMLLLSLNFAFSQSFEVVIVGNSKEKKTKEMLSALNSKYVPNKVVLLVPAEEENPEIFKLAEFTKKQKPLDGKATVFVCKNFSCNKPVTSIQEMLELLQ